MNALRAKLIAVIVGAILLVVGLATSITIIAISPPRMELAYDQMAAQIRLILNVASKDIPTTDNATGTTDRPMPSETAEMRAGFQPAATPGRWLDGPSRDLSDALRRHGISTAVMVTWSEGKRWPTASIKISDAEWLVLPSALPPPMPMGLPSLAGWLLLIALGTTGVALIVVHRLTQPLALVVRTVTRIGPEGEVPELPEIGPPEVRATARAINMLSSRLKSAMESRMRLVAAAGHDLRTPMTRLRLRAEFLEDDRDKWLADLDELDRIADSAIRLVREETEGTPADTVRLDEMVGDIAAELQELRLDIRMTNAQAASVRARPLSLKRALRNLMINAATHGGGASVRVAAEARVAVIMIEDRGPGIPEALLEHAFEPFFRVDPARKASVPGAGLGLAIAREIIQRNLGQLKLTNRQGGGLTQRVTLPLTGADA